MGSKVGIVKPTGRSHGSWVGRLTNPVNRMRRESGNRAETNEA